MGQWKKNLSKKLTGLFCDRRKREENDRHELQSVKGVVRMRV
jgi:hypothetical protein